LFNGVKLICKKFYRSFYLSLLTHGVKKSPLHSLAIISLGKTGCGLSKDSKSSPIGEANIGPGGGGIGF
jgi:hypothetical protein